MPPKLIKTNCGICSVNQLIQFWRRFTLKLLTDQRTLLHNDINHEVKVTKKRCITKETLDYKITFVYKKLVLQEKSYNPKLLHFRYYIFVTILIVI